MTFLKNKSLIIPLLLFIIVLGDYFFLARLDPISRRQVGYPFSYPSTVINQWQDTPYYGLKRIGYNFGHFGLFWLKMSEGAVNNNFYQFFTQDGNPLWMNKAHLICFFLFTLILLWWFRIKWWLAFLIGFFINVFHEYVAEGIYVDPSFIDLWIDLVGIILGLFIGLVVLRYQNKKIILTSWQLKSLILS